MFERRLYFHIDWLLLGAVLLLAAIGLSMIYSTTYVTLPDGSGHPGPRFWVQLYAVGLGAIALAIFLAIDYRFLAEHSIDQCPDVRIAARIGHHRGQQSRLGTEDRVDRRHRNAGRQRDRLDRGRRIARPREHLPRGGDDCAPGFTGLSLPDRGAIRSTRPLANLLCHQLGSVLESRRAGR